MTPPLCDASSKPGGSGLEAVRTRRACERGTSEAVWASAGSEGGLRKRTGRKTITAPQADLTSAARNEGATRPARAHLPRGRVARIRPSVAASTSRSRITAIAAATLDGARPCSRRLRANRESSSAVISSSRAAAKRGPTCRRYCCAYASSVLGARSTAGYHRAHHSPTVMPDGPRRADQPDAPAPGPGMTTGYRHDTPTQGRVSPQFDNDLDWDGCPGAHTTASASGHAPSSSASRRPPSVPTTVRHNAG